MDHQVVAAVEKALCWPGPELLGAGFARGALPDAALCERLLTPSKLLDLIMRRSLEPPQFRCFQDGHELHPNEYVTSMVTRRRQAIRMVDMHSLARLAGEGFTAVLDALDVFDPTMEIACRAFQWWSRERVQVNAYLTTQDAPGFPLHFDDHDVLIVQLAGHKNWEVRGSSRVAPMYRDAMPNLTPSDELVWSGALRAGDVMHIPRGYWHRATRDDCGAGLSLHVTFGFVKRTGVDWLAWVADRSREEELFRRDLIRSGTSGGRAIQDDALTSTAGALLSQWSPEKFLARREQESIRTRVVPALTALDESGSIVCVTEFPPQMSKVGEHVLLVAAGKKLTFKRAAVPALRKLVSGDPVQVGKVSAETGVDARRLGDVLIQEGICAQLTEELSSGYTGLITSERS
ncbi:MAG: JmjC domain-containing protein [Pseudonocardiaceae bacterium]